MAFRIEKNIINDNVEPPQKSPVQQEQKQDVVPVGQVEETKTDTEQPVEGYDGSDDEPDTDMHTDEKISIDDIALGQSDKISEAVQSAQLSGLNSAISDDYARLERAKTMAKSDPFNILDQSFKKGFHGNGIFRYQYADYSYMFDVDLSEITKTTHTRRIDFSSTYESPKGNTKLIFLGSGAKTDKYLKYYESYQEDENLIPAPSDVIDNSGIAQSVVSSQNQIEETVPTESNETASQYHLFLGGKFKLGNDVLYANVMHAKGGDLDKSILTEVDAKYTNDKFGVTFEGSLEVYNVGHLSTTKTDLSCYLGSKKDEQIEQENISSGLATNEQEKTETEEQAADASNVQNNTKKCVKNDGIVIKMGSVDGREVENGVGYCRTTKKYDENSFFKTTMFSLASTTPRKEETSSYHATAGVNILYKYKNNRDLSYDVNLDVKDKISFCGADKGNIFTAFLDANCKYKKTNAKLEGKYIYTPFSTYFGMALRMSYQLNKNIL